MKNLAMIACISKDGGLGKDGDLLWHIPEDMKFFKTTTMGGAIVMGRKTFASIGRALPGRENVILSHRGVEADGVKCFRDVSDLTTWLDAYPGKKFIIGGASLYEQFLAAAETIYLTEVDAVQPADTFFPELPKAELNVETVARGEYEGAAYKILKYTRKESYAK